MLRLIVLLILSLIVTTEAIADSCSPSGQFCSKRGNVTVAGVTIYNVCTEVAKTEDCIRNTPLNTCNTFEPITISPATTLGNNQCHLTSEVCVRSTAGKCDKYERTYRCWNGPAQAPYAQNTARTFHNFNENLSDNCSALEADGNCQLDSTAITQGSETRHINQLAVNRSFWQKTRTYDCTNNSYEDTCGDYENNPVCVQKDVGSCLAYDDQGNCQYEQYIYECDADSSFEANCEAINVCIGDNCSGVAQEPSNDYPKAAAWLNLLDDMADKNKCEAADGTSPTGVTEQDCADPNNPNISADPQIFSGELKSCDFHVTKNCCADANTESRCNEEERELLAQRQAGAVHYLGLGCAYRLFGICITEQYEYCTYKSKFARVFQEQAHLQLGTQFNWPNQPEPCPALSIQQLEQVDVNAMDLSEVFGDMLANTEVPVEQLVVDRLQNNMGVFGGDVRDTYE